nr:hypothetical protein [Tanacetum cinerariifolium]
MVAILEKSDAAGGFEQIIDFLSGSYIHHALTVNPHVYISCIKQFQNTVVVKRLSDVTRVGKGFTGVETPLFENMLAVRAVDAEEEVQVLAQDDVVQEHVTEEIATEQVLDTCSALVLRVEGLENANAAQKLEIVKLKASVKKLERLNKGRISVDIETDEGVKLVVDQEKNAEVAAASTPIPAAKPKILKIAAALAVSTRRRKGVVIRDPEEELHTDTPAETPTVKDKGKGILIEDPKPIKKKDQYIKRYHGFKKKPQSESEAHKNMISYLKNTKGYKMEFFKGKTYDQILPIFQARFNANLKFLFKSREEIEKENEEIIKSINETPAQKVTKRRKLSEEA